jgi:hypothetical protein
MTTMSWCSGRVYVCVVHDVEPSDAEWAYFIDLCRQREGQDLRALVESRKTGPNAKQRRLLAEVTADMDYRAAILTDSLVTRGIVTALSWLGVPQKPFPLDHFAEAGDYLGLAPDELEVAMRELVRMRQPSLRYAETG